MYDLRCKYDVKPPINQPNSSGSVPTLLKDSCHWDDKPQNFDMLIFWSLCLSIVYTVVSLALKGHVVVETFHNDFSCLICVGIQCHRISCLNVIYSKYSSIEKKLTQFVCKHFVISD